MRDVLCLFSVYANFRIKIMCFMYSATETRGALSLSLCAAKPTNIAHTIMAACGGVWMCADVLRLDNSQQHRQRQTVRRIYWIMFGFCAAKWFACGGSRLSSSPSMSIGIKKSPLVSLSSIRAPPLARRRASLKHTFVFFFAAHNMWWYDEWFAAWQYVWGRRVFMDLYAKIKHTKEDSIRNWCNWI